MSNRHTYTLAAALLLGGAGSVHAGTPALDIKFAGALEFKEDGTLFVGDNYSGAIYAFKVPAARTEGKVTPTSLANIDAKIAELLGVGVGAIEINDMAVHPVSQEIFISTTRMGSFASQPAIVRVSQGAQLSVLDMAALDFQKQALTAFPKADAAFKVRGAGPNPPLPRDIAKGEVSISSLAIMDIEYHRGQLFVAGVAHDNFLSSLRRIPYPFNGTQSIANVEMYHIAHDQYESRAPIRAMSVQDIDGEPHLVAAYTCSPIVLIPLKAIKDGAKIAAKTIIDYGNGQPLDMVPFKMQGQTMLFVTSNSRSPQVIPVQGLNGAKAVTPDSLPRGPKLDLHPLMPYGPAGKAVMFEGVPLHLALVGENFFAAITRDAYTGSLNLDINPTFFPNRVHNLVAEMDFPPLKPAAAQRKE
jgi:hypothetical protein